MNSIPGLGGSKLATKPIIVKPKPVPKSDDEAAVPQQPTPPPAPQQPTAPPPQSAPPPAPPRAAPPIFNPSNDVFEEDFTDEDGSGFKIASEGFHHAKVIDFEKGESSNGNPQYVWQFMITVGVDMGIEVRSWSSLLPQARWRVVAMLEAIGIEAAGSVCRFSKSDIIGKPCILEIEHNEYDGKINHRVATIHPPNEDSIQAANDKPQI